MQWVCGICNYAHDNDEAPEVCPVCGAPRSSFSEYYEDEEGFFSDDSVVNDRDSVDDYYGEFDE